MLEAVSPTIHCRSWLVRTQLAMREHFAHGCRRLLGPRFVIWVTQGAAEHASLKDAGAGLCTHVQPDMPVAVRAGA
jgi:hypothetical protein